MNFQHRPRQPGKPRLDVRDYRGKVGVAKVKGVLLETAAWELLCRRCREMEDDEFKIKSVANRRIEFMLTDRAGKFQDYTINAIDLIKTSRASGKRFMSLFLTFDVNGTATVDTSTEWFQPIRCWLMYWADKGPHPRILRQIQAEKVATQSQQTTDERISRFMKSAERN